MTKSELIKCFENDKGTSELKVWLSKLVSRLNKVCDKLVRAGVEHSSFYVVDSEYHIFCGGFHLRVVREEQDPWLPDEYTVTGGMVRKKGYCYNFSQLEQDIKRRLGVMADLKEKAMPIQSVVNN